ncbi:MAG TPA: hypothetical protein VGG99_10000 [Acetobacteraceae bacterium]
MPADLKFQLDRDARPQWVILDDMNRFMWPGYDLRRLPGTVADRSGMIPEPLFRAILQDVLACHLTRKGTLTDRDRGTIAP